MRPTFYFLDIHNDDLTVIGRHPIGVPVYEVNVSQALDRHNEFIRKQIFLRKEKDGGQNSVTPSQ